MEQPNPQQKSVIVERHVSASAAALWALLSDFEHIDRWSDLEVRAIEGSGVGCVRTVAMKNGAVVMERLVACDPQALSLTYEAVEPNPFPMREYRSTVTLTPLDAGNCHLHWAGSYLLPAGADAAKTEALLNKVYQGGIDLLARHLNAAN